MTKTLHISVHPGQAHCLNINRGSTHANDVAHEMRSVSSSALLIDARLSFTTHHRATLFDLEVDVREIFEEPDLQPTDEVHPLYQAPKVIFADQWDADLGFAKLLADLSVEALNGKGDLIQMR